MNYFFSVIIPIYNRPEELKDLLNSFIDQTYDQYEILVIEDGSSLTCQHIAEQFKTLPLQYYYKENGGQGFARNFGFKRAKGDYFIVLDSDVLLPKNYLKSINNFLQDKNIDAFGGPDCAHESFSLIQKAISQSMTSFITTGGLRGKAQHVGTYHPRSFNMGISKEVFQKTGGYKYPYKGEDIDFSIRIIEAGFKTTLIEEAVVYHKRRTSWKQFFRQTRFFGTARVFIEKVHPKTKKFIFKLPSIFLIGLILWCISFFVYKMIFTLGVIGLALLSLGILIEALLKSKSILVAVLSVFASYVQLIGYGLGYLEAKFWGHSGASHHSPEK